MSFFSTQIRKNKIRASLAFLILLLIGVFSPGSALATIYQPGETLEPDCAPTDANCGIASFPSTVGTSTPIGASILSVVATSSNAIPLTIRGYSGQAVNLFQVQNSSGVNFFTIDNGGGSQFDANLILNGSITVSDPSDFNDLVTFAGSGLALTVTNNATIGGTLGVTGLTTLVNASTTNLSVSGSSYLGNVLSGSWQGTEISATKGGTGLTSFAVGDILYASATNTLAKLGIGAAGTVLTASVTGVPTWGAAGGSGSGNFWATSTDGLIVYPSDVNRIVLVGSSATSSSGNIFEVTGNSKFVGDTVAVNSTTTGSLYAGNVYGSVQNATLARLGNSTFSTLQDMQNVFHSAGWTSGGILTDIGSGNISVSAGTGLIRPTNSAISTIYYFDWAASSTIAIPSGSIRYIGVEYNGGSPRVTSRTSANWNYKTDFPIGVANNEGGVIHVVSDFQAVGDHAANMIQREYEVMPLARDERNGGLELAESADGNRHVSLSAGALWDRLNRFSIPAINSATGDVFDTYLGTDLYATGQSTWDNTHYHDHNMMGMLATMTDNYYAVHWVYVETDGDIVLVYGNGQYASLALAVAEDAPMSDMIPDRLVTHGKLVGRIIFKKGQTTATEVNSAFVMNAMNSSALSYLANLSGLDYDSSGLTGFVASGGVTGGQTIIGGKAASNGLTLQSTNATGTSDYIKMLVGTNGATEAMRILSNGNVGIGTATPDRAFSVAGNGSFGGDLLVSTFNVSSTALFSGALNASSTLQVTGASRFISTGQFDGALTAAGAGTGLSVTNNATVGGTLGVTGVTTLGSVSSTLITASGGIVNEGNLRLLGNFITPKGTDYLTTGAQNDVDFGTGFMFHYGGAGSATFSGIAGGVEGRTIRILNDSAYDVVFLNESSLSLAQNRIELPAGSDITLGPEVSITLQYESVSARWHVVALPASASAIAAYGYLQNGNSFGASAVIGTNDANSLSLETGGSTRFTLASNAATLTGTGATTITTNNSLSLSSASASALNITAGTTGALTLDSGSTGAINLGTSSFSKTITIGNSTGTTGVVMNLGSSGLSVNGIATITGKSTLAGVSSTDITASGFLNGATLNISGAAILGSTVDITGKTTLANASGTNFTASGFLNGATLNISGLSTLASASTTNITASGFLNGATLNISGLTTLTAASTTNITASGFLNSATLNTSGAASVGSTLGVTGKSTLANVSSTDITASGFLNGASLNISSGSTTLRGISYSWPSADGSSNQVLKTNGSGLLSWTTVSSGASASGTAGTIQFSDGSNGLNSNALFNWDNSNNRLAIGTSASPSSTLHVVGNMIITGSESINGVTYTWPNSQGGAGQVLTNDGAGLLTWSAGGGAGSASWANLLSPTSSLTLSMASNTTDFVYNASTGSSNLFTIEDTTNNSGTGILVNVVGSAGSSINPFRVSASGTTAIAIDPTGKVSIGTTTASTTLYVAGTFSSTGKATLAGVSSTDITASGFLNGATLNISGLTTLASASTTNLTASGFLNSATLNTSGAASIGSTLGVTGKATLANVSSTDITASGFLNGASLNISGLTTLTAASTTNFTASGFINSATLNTTGAAILGSTVDITGKTTLANASGTNFTASGFLNGATLNISGLTTLTAASTTNITASGFLNGATLNISGLTTLTAASTTNLTASGFINSATLNTTGAASIGSTLGVTGSATFSGSFVTPKGSDHPTTGIQNDVDLGTGSLFRYTGAGTATFTGIAGGVDGAQIRIMNVSGSTLTLSNQHASSTASNRIITTSGADLNLPTEVSVGLQYDGGASRWRVVVLPATTGTIGGFTFLQSGNAFGATASLGTTDANALNLITSGNTRLTLASGSATLTGTGATALTTDAGSALNLNTGTTGILTLDSGTTGAVNIGTGSNAKTVTIGNGSGATSLVLNAGTGNIDIGANAVARTINIGTGASVIENINIGGTGANVVAIANTQTGGSVSVGAAMTTGTVSIGGTGAQTGAFDVAPGTGAQTVTFANGSGIKTINIGSGVSGNTIAIGNGANSVAQTLNIASGAAGANSTVNILAGVATAGTQTLNLGTGASAKTVNIGNTTGASAVTIDSGTGAISIGTGAQARTVNIANGGAVQTVTLGSTNGASTLTLEAGTGALNIGTGAFAKTITMGNATGATGLALNSGTGGITLLTATTGAVSIKSGTTGAVTLDSGTTGAVNIGTGNNAKTISIGTGTAGDTINIASNNTTADTLTIGSALDTMTLGAGTINITNPGAQQNGSTVLCVLTNRLRLGASNTSCQTSSRRFKHDIANLPAGLDVITSLEPVSYKYNDNNTFHYGLIAEDVYKAIPTAVVLDAEGLPYALDYNEITPVIINSIKDIAILLGEVSPKQEGENSSNGIETLLASIRSEAQRSVAGVFEAKIANSARFLTDFVSARVTAIRGYFEEISAKKIHTEQMCVKKSDGTEVCVSGDQISEILNKNKISEVSQTAPAAENNSAVGTQPEPTTSSSGSVPPADEAPTSTPVQPEVTPVTEEVGSPVLAEPAATQSEPVATPTTEPVVESSEPVATPEPTVEQSPVVQESEPSPAQIEEIAPSPVAEPAPEAPASNEASQ